LDSWDIRTLDVEPHHPQILRSDEETRVIAINLPGGEQLQDHQVHERAYVVVVEGEVEIQQDGNASQTAGPGARHHGCASALDPFPVAGRGPSLAQGRVTTAS
jgi:hypothetical protein